MLVQGVRPGRLGGAVGLVLLGGALVGGIRGFGRLP